MFFGGEYSHSIDAKGRITIPAKLRAELGENPVVSRGAEHNLDLRSQEGWDNLVKAVLNSPASLSKKRQMKRELFSKACVCNYDKQGRILIPAELRKMADITKEVMVVGVGDMVELWDKERYMNLDVMNDEEFADLADQVLAQDMQSE